MKIIGVTACPTGIAHTYMAAEALERAAKARGHVIKVETQGSMGLENALSDAEVQLAEVVILAVDMKVDGMERFADKPVLKVGVAEAIRKPDEVLNRAEELARRGSVEKAENAVEKEVKAPAPERPAPDANNSETGRRSWFPWFKK